MSDLLKPNRKVSGGLQEKSFFRAPYHSGHRPIKLGCLGLSVESGDSILPPLLTLSILQNQIRLGSDSIRELLFP